MLFEKQQYQQDCVDNIIRVLGAVDFANADYRNIQRGLSELREKDAAYKQFEILPEQPRLDVLMETGTGKTFVYLQTIFELHKRYKRNKFIIVLPRTAIKEGVMQNIRLTDAYFFNLYQKHLNFINYPKDGLSSIQNDFINSDDLCVLITTNSAFNSEKNNINKKTETLFQYGSTWNGIAAQKPVVIIDEPHLLKGGQTKQGLDKLTHSLFIRFGATYPQEEGHKLSNVVYTLDSVNAFRKYLVKRIGVSTVYAGREQRDIAVTNISAQKKKFDLCYSVDKMPRSVTLRPNDDIGAKTGLAEYNGIFPVKILTSRIRLSDYSDIESRVSYTLGDEEMRLMMREAIERHFQKEQNFFEKQVKALTLFFIPNVNDFRGDNPRVKTMFEEEYAAVREEVYQSSTNADYRAYLDNDHDGDALRVHEGYFAGDKGTADEKEHAGVEIILRQKERLLSFEEPLRFVFSVWALQEGWDNPNIFTICKLAASDKENSRRQQVGRGLRLAVNQAGKRLSFSHLQDDEQAFYDINTLDMVVSGQEQTFIHQIQSEINDASYAFVGEKITLDAMKAKGLKDAEAALIYTMLQMHGIISKEDGIVQSPIIDFLRNNRELFALIEDARYKEICKIFEQSHRPSVINNNQRKVNVTIRDDKWADFKQLWEHINRQAKITYQRFSEDALIANISRDFNNETIAPVSARVERKILDAQQNEILSDSEDAAQQLYVRGVDIAQVAFEFMAHSQDMVLPKRFIFNLFAKLNRRHFDNDRARAERLLRQFIKDRIHDGILQSVRYDITETVIYPNGLQKADGKKRESLDSTALGMFTDEHSPPHFLYDRIVFDSAIEKDSIQGDPQRVDNDREITVFAKLPKISIPTPHKTYNPDFAYLISRKGQKALFLIVETKGYDSEHAIPQEERQKINYGRKFFERLNEVLKDVAEVRYETRINRQALSELLREIARGE